MAMIPKTASEVPSWKKRRSYARSGPRMCLICKGQFYPKRVHAKTCGATCRKALSRAISDK